MDEKVNNDKWEDNKRENEEVDNPIKTKLTRYLRILKLNNSHKTKLWRCLSPFSLSS